MRIKPVQIQLQVPFLAGPVNCYLINGPEPTLVDCGLNTTTMQETVVAGLAAEGLTLADLKHVVITHAHVDHMGMANWLCENSAATVWVSPLVYPWAVDLRGMWSQRLVYFKAALKCMGASDEMIAQAFSYMDQLTSMWESVPAERVRQFTLDGTLTMGNAEWEVLFLPGHCYHQTGFYQRDEGWLISADCLLPRTPVPVLESTPDRPMQRSVGFPTHLESLKGLRALDVSAAFPGHGDVMTDHRAVIDQQLARVVMRKQEVLNLVTSGAGTVFEMAEIMYGHYPKAARVTGASTIVGYLDLLSAEGRVVSTAVDGIWRYTLTSV